MKDTFEHQLGSQIIREHAAALKTMAKNHFIKMIRRHIASSDTFKELRGDAVGKVICAISFEILGHAGEYRRFNDEEDGKEEFADNFDSADSEKKHTQTFREYLEGIENSHAIKVTQNELRMINEMKPLSREQLRLQFLPACFKDYVSDEKTGHGWKSTLFPNGILLILSFFHQVNQTSGKHQLIFPTANAVPRYVQITSTILAAIWTRFLKDHKHLQSQLDLFPGMLCMA